MAAEVTNRTDTAHDDLAWGFLGSEFADSEYANWPIERRLSAFLSRNGRRRDFEDGDEFNSLFERVMENIRPALRMGLLDRQRIGSAP